MKMFVEGTNISFLQRDLSKENKNGCKRVHKNKKDAVKIRKIT